MVRIQYLALLPLLVGALEAAVIIMAGTAAPEVAVVTMVILGVLVTLHPHLHHKEITAVMEIFLRQITVQAAVVARVLLDKMELQRPVETAGMERHPLFLVYL
jgi:hypothetical protein